MNHIAYVGSMHMVLLVCLYLVLHSHNIHFTALKTLYTYLLYFAWADQRVQQFYNYHIV